MARGSQPHQKQRVSVTPGNRPELAEPGLAEPEPKPHLIVNHFTGALKAVALVEGEGAAVAVGGARVQHLDSGSATEVLDDQVERRGAEALALVRSSMRSFHRYCGM